MTKAGLSDDDLAVDHELADIAASFRFLLDLTPIDLAGARRAFDADGRPPRFRYRALEDDPAVVTKRLDGLAVDTVADPALASLLLAKQRELRLQLEMLCCRDTPDFLPLSIELYGAVSPTLLREARTILDDVAPPGPSAGPWLDASAFAARAQTELDHYRSLAPSIESHVEVREGSTGVMVSNGDVLIAPTAQFAASRVDALLQHEVGTHVVTHVNGAAQPLHVLASGLAGHDETQEGLAVLAEHLVGGLTARRLRQLAGRVVAVHAMVESARFDEVHGDLVDSGMSSGEAFSITARVYRSGGLTKDAIYLRGLRELVDHLASGGSLSSLWLGKLPLQAAPVVADLHQRGALQDPLVLPRYLEAADARQRLAHLPQVTSLTSLIGDTA